MIYRQMSSDPPDNLINQYGCVPVVGNQQRTYLTLRTRQPRRVTLKGSHSVKLQDSTFFHYDKNAVAPTDLVERRQVHGRL